MRFVQPPECVKVTRHLAELQKGLGPALLLLCQILPPAAVRGADTRDFQAHRPGLGVATNPAEITNNVLVTNTAGAAETMSVTNLVAPREKLFRWKASREDRDGLQLELARKTENPLADLITVPLQHNWDFGIGPQKAMKYTVKLQPIIPFPLGTNWVLLSRTILPITYAEASAPGDHDKSGLKDTSLSLFLSPKSAGPRGLFWGAGPAFQLPTASDEGLGDGKWGAGPTVAVSEQQGEWTGYILTRHIWSFAGDRDRPFVSETLLQPSLSYTFKTRTTVGLVSEAKYDWQAQQWTVPINLTASQLFKTGKVPLKLTLGGRLYAERPAGGPDWGLRFAMTFLFPK